MLHLQDTGQLDELVHIAPMPAEDRWLLLVHTRNYLNQLKRSAADAPMFLDPDTGITLARIGDGPRVGGFLFSVETVQRLRRSYAHARHLPYKQGVTGGMYEEWVHSDRTERARDKQARNRLKPVDGSRPSADGRTADNDEAGSPRNRHSG